LRVVPIVAAVVIPCMLVLSLFCTHALGGDAPFTAPSNWGGTGLLETPTARMMEEGAYRVGVSNIDPYWYYYGTLSLLENLEVNGRITKVEGIPALTANYGDTKDKAVDIKYRLWKEGKYRPALAVGIMDPHGTRLYAAQYLVASKQIYPFDFTIGLGNGRFGKTPLPAEAQGFRVEMFNNPKSWLSDAQFFGGIHFAPSEKFRFMVEYSPIDYHRQTNDPAQGKYFREPVPSHFNVGFSWKPYPWSEIGISYQRGEQLGINLSVAFNVKEPLVPIYDHPYREEGSESSDPLIDRLVRALHVSGFSDIGISLQRDALKIDVQNDRYYYTPRAIDVIMTLLAEIAPESVHDIRIILKENGIPVVAFDTTRDDIAELYAGELTFGQFFTLASMDTAVQDVPAGEKYHRRRLSYGIKPAFRTFLNDPSGFFKYRLGISTWAGIHPWKGASVVAALEAYPVNTVSTSNKPIPNAVRSDIVSYQEETVALQALMFGQILKGARDIHMRGAAGLLEVEYAGIDGEIAMPLLDGRFLVGVSGSAVKKREPGSPFALKDTPEKDLYTTSFFNTRLNIPEKDIAIDLKAGRFLAGDKGARFTVHKFFNGVIFSAWYSLTDTDIFSDNFNRGYHDKGISLTIPLRFFKGSDSKTQYTFSLSPWTRDVAQDIDHFNSLFDYIGRNAKIYLDKDKQNLQ